jgi:hypothetical protein
MSNIKQPVLFFLKMRCRPFPYDVRKWGLDFWGGTRKPSQLSTDSLLFKFGRTPDEGRAKCADHDGEPVIGDKERSGDGENPQAHHVRPPKKSEPPLGLDNKRESQPDDEQGEDTGEETKRVHSNRLLVSGRFLEQVNHRCGWVLCHDFYMARVARVGRGMSLADAALLASEFECIPERGDAKDAENR